MEEAGEIASVPEGEASARETGSGLLARLAVEVRLHPEVHLPDIVPSELEALCGDVRVDVPEIGRADSALDQLAQTERLVVVDRETERRQRREQRLETRRELRVGHEALSGLEAQIQGSERVHRDLPDLLELSRREFAIHRLSPCPCGLPLSEHLPDWGLPRLDWTTSSLFSTLFGLNKAKNRLKNKKLR